MELPRNVRQTQERTDAMLDEVVKAQTAAANPPEPDPPTEPDTPEPEPKATPAPVEEDTFKARYESLQGKYNAEVPRLAAQLRGEREKVEGLERQISELTAKVEQLQQAPQPNDDDDLIERIRAEHGDDLVQLVERVAQRKATETIQPLREVVTPIQKETQQQRQQREHEQKIAQFTDMVGKLVPDWQSIDTTPAFQMFLNELEGDRPRGERLNDAIKNYDAGAAALLFAEFKASQPKPHAQTKGKDALAAQLVPETTGGSQAPPSKKVFTRSEISAFYAAAAQGKAGTEEQVQHMEREIEAAVREGRVR